MTTFNTVPHVRRIVQSFITDGIKPSISAVILVECICTIWLLSDMQESEDAQMLDELKSLASFVLKSLRREIPHGHVKH